MMFFGIRGIGLQKQADCAGCASLLPGDVAELVWLLVIAIHLTSSLSKKGPSCPTASDGGTRDTLIGEESVS